MARAAKVPKTRLRYLLHVDQSHGYQIVDSDQDYRPVARELSYGAADMIQDALNILEAIERGELIVKEAE